MGSFLPPRDVDLLNWALNASATVNAAAAAYGVPTATATAFVTKTTAFQVAMTANEKGIRSKATVATKNVKRKELRDMAYFVSRLVEGTSTVTDAMKYEAGFNVKRTPAHRPAPVIVPLFVITGVSRNTVSARLQDAANSTRRSLPANIASATVFSYVGATPPTTAVGWKFEANTNRSDFEIAFDDALPMGTKVWFCAFWSNAKQQSSNACDPVSAILFGSAALPRSVEELKIAA